MDGATFNVPITTDEVLAGLDDRTVFELERDHGNTDLIRAIEAAQIAGPFTSVSPWELEDPSGVRRINAAGYAAIPFGERYPPLMDFLDRYLAKSRQIGLPVQSLAPWRAALEAELVRLVASLDTSHSDSRVFFTNSGSEANEAAIKLAKAFRPNATYFVNFKRAFHGKTTGALSITSNEDCQSPFRPLAYETLTLPFGDLEAFEALLARKDPKHVIAVMLEPIQGEAGVIVPPQTFLTGIDRLSKQYGIPVIADEIQAGLARSGYLVPSIEWGGMSPDILTFAKPLGGGLTPVGAAVARKAIYRKMLGGMNFKTHSNTFGGNSMSMAIGLKSLEIIRDEGLVARSRVLGKIGLERLEALARRHPKLIKEVRGFGLWFAIEFHPVVPDRIALGMKDLVGEFTTILALMMFHRGGLHANLAANSHRTIRLTPPLTIPEDLYDAMFDQIDAVADEIGSASKLLIRTPPTSMVDLARISMGV